MDTALKPPPVPAAGWLFVTQSGRLLFKKESAVLKPSSWAGYICVPSTRDSPSPLLAAQSHPAACAAMKTSSVSATTSMRTRSLFVPEKASQEMVVAAQLECPAPPEPGTMLIDRKSTRLNSNHQIISYAVFCLKKKKKNDRSSSNMIIVH